MDVVLFFLNSELGENVLIDRQLLKIIASLSILLIKRHKINMACQQSNRKLKFLFSSSADAVNAVLDSIDEIQFLQDTPWIRRDVESMRQVLNSSRLHSLMTVLNVILY